MTMESKEVLEFLYSSQVLFDFIIFISLKLTYFLYLLPVDSSRTHHHNSHLQFTFTCIKFLITFILSTICSGVGSQKDLLYHLLPSSPPLFYLKWSSVQPFHHHYNSLPSKTRFISSFPNHVLSHVLSWDFLPSSWISRPTYLQCRRRCRQPPPTLP